MKSRNSSSNKMSRVRQDVFEKKNDFTSRSNDVEKGQLDTEQLSDFLVIDM